MRRGNVPDDLLDTRLLQVLDLAPRDFVKLFIPRNMLRLSCQPSQQRKVLSEHIGEAVEQVVG